MRRSIWIAVLLGSLLPLSAMAQLYGCNGNAQPQTAEMLKQFKTVTLPYTYKPAAIGYGPNGEEPVEYARSAAFGKKYLVPLQQIVAVHGWQTQRKPGAVPLREFSRETGLDELDLLPLVKFAAPNGETGIVMRMLPHNAESTEQTWVAILCTDGRVRKVTNIEPGSMRADITNYTYTVKSVINADLSVDYWRNRIKGGAESTDKSKPYDKGRLNLLH